MSETLNNTEERQLLDAVKRAVDLVDKGFTPDDAIEKVARDEGYGPGKIKLVAHAYNNGRQLSQWNQGGNILDKLAFFPLADPYRIINRIYNGPTPKEKEAAEAVDPDYHFPPSWIERPLQEKRARAPLPLPASAPLTPYRRDPLEDLNKAYGRIQREKQMAEEASRQAGAAEDKVRMKVAALVAYFKQANYARMPFEHAEVAARSYFGNAAVPLMDIVYKQARLREKRASDRMPVMAQGVNLQVEPFSIIREAIAAAEECNKLRAVAMQKKADARQVKESALRPFLNAGESRPSVQPSPVLLTLGAWDDRAANVFQTKQAMGFGTEVAAIALGDIAGQAIHHRIDPLMQQQHGGEEWPSHEEEELNFDDVAQQREIAGIKSRATLDGMLADPRNPLSKLPAPRVVAAYNSLIKGKPGLIADADKLQSLLEKHFNLGRSKTAQEKSAILDLASAGAGVQVGRMLGNPVKDKDSLIEDKWMELEDPHHQNELRKIRAYTLLTQLMTDPDDPISGHDPDKVLQAYNELASASPRVADNLHTLRPALRRKLEGNQEPFEAKELLDIEKGLAAAKLPTPNTNILGHAPDKLLG